MACAEHHATLVHVPPSAFVLADSSSLTEGTAAYRAGTLVVTRPWLRPTPGSARIVAGYLQIVNTGNEPDRLIGGSAPIAGQLEIHAAEVADGVVRMRALRDGVEIPPGQTIDLRPGGRHLMFARLTGPIEKGARFKATLVFEKAGPVEIEFDVRNQAGGDDEGAEH